jgi:GTP-binding protein
MEVVRLTPHGERTTGRIEYLFTYHNLSRQDVDTVEAGDIIALGGLDTLGISDTIADPVVTEGLPPISVEAPTVRMTFGVNSSPFAGREGKTGWGTSRRLRQRLFDETRSNVALRVEDGESADRFIVSGRGELHLGILIETMRREGYEFDVSRPEVIYREDSQTGHLLEPIEDVYVEVADELTGTVVELMGARRGELLDMSSDNGTTSIRYRVPTRFLIGFQSRFMRATSGLGQIHTLFHGYAPLAPGAPPSRQFGSLVALENGTATAYALLNAQSRGTFFIEPGAEVYKGMVVGENSRTGDLDLNVARTKHLTNHRAKPTENAEFLTPPRRMSLDDFIEFLADDELLEVTPDSLRIRKRIMNNEQRIRERKRREKQLAG